MEFLVGLNPGSPARLIPSPILGFAIAAMLYRLLASIGLQGPAIPLAEVESSGPSGALRYDELVSYTSHKTNEPPSSEPTPPEAHRDR
jgi:hypothetical protein